MVVVAPDMVKVTQGTQVVVVVDLVVVAVIFMVMEAEGVD
jgi:hypothetical protein